MRYPLVIDAFPFYNELGMLEYRLSTLENHVDYHVVVESNRTFAGNEKPLFFLNNVGLFKKYASKIIHVVVDDMPGGGDAWKRENYQRDAGIPAGLSQIPMLEGSDLVVVSDLDEIPNPEVLKRLKEGRHRGFARLAQDLYYFKPTRENFWSRWEHSFVADVETLSSGPRLSVARTEGRYPVIEGGGWHFSYFLPSDLVKNKIKEFAHQEECIQRFSEGDHVERALAGETTLYERERNHSSPSTPLPRGTEELLDRIDVLSDLVRV